MNLREEILKEHGKAQTNRIIAWVGNDAVRFSELFDLFTGDDKVIAQRAGWPMSYCVIAFPPLINKHFKKLISNLSKSGIHPAVRRNTVRLLQHVTIPERHSGAVMDLCFNFVASPTEPVAVKAFSLTVLHNLSKVYPDVVPEIKLLIESRWEHETAAFKSRARRLGMGYEVWGMGYGVWGMGKNNYHEFSVNIQYSTLNNQCSL